MRNSSIQDYHDTITDAAPRPSSPGRVCVNFRPARLLGALCHRVPGHELELLLPERGGVVRRWQRGQRARRSGPAALVTTAARAAHPTRASPIRQATDCGTPDDRTAERLFCTDGTCVQCGATTTVTTRPWCAATPTCAYCGGDERPHRPRRRHSPLRSTPGVRRVPGRHHFASTRPAGVRRGQPRVPRHPAPPIRECDSQVCNTGTGACVDRPTSSTRRRPARAVHPRRALATPSPGPGPGHRRHATSSGRPAATPARSRSTA